VILNIRGWTFNTEDVRSVRYRYSLRRLILVFATRMVEVEMPQQDGESLMQRIEWAWSTERDC
jgi:hypothetical protein